MKQTRHGTGAKESHTAERETVKLEQKRDGGRPQKSNGLGDNVPDCRCHVSVSQLLNQKEFWGQVFGGLLFVFSTSYSIT